MADKRPLVNNAGTVQEIAAGDTVPLTNGGTGAITASAARTNLAVPGLADNSTITGTWTFNNSITSLGTVSGSSAAGFRNKLINGDFQIWQRGTTFTDPTGATNIYCADRWGVLRGGWETGITVTQQVTQTGSKSIRVQRNNGNSSTANLSLTTSLETIEVKKLAGKTVTLQFKALKGANYSAISNLFGVQLFYDTGTDGNMATSFTGQTTVINSIATLTASNTLYTYTATIPSNATQLGIVFSETPTGTAGAADYFEITDVQLEEGSVATPFERRPYGLEELLCKRYYEVSASGNTFYGSLLGSADPYRSWYIQFKVEKRANPLMSVSGGNASPTLSSTTTSATGTYSAGNSTLNLYFTKYIADSEL